jgi:hypothetical protein
MKRRYQFGYHLFFFILWRTVPASVFGDKIRPLFLAPEQMETIGHGELLPIFNDSFLLRDGWRLYRSIPME